MDEPEILELPEDEENVTPVGSAGARKLRGRGRELAAAHRHRVAVEELAELEFNAFTQEGLPVGHELCPSRVIREGRLRRGGGLPAWAARHSRLRGALAGKGSDRGGGPLRRRLQTAAERPPAPVTSLPRQRPAQARVTRGPRGKSATAAEPALADDPGWAKFVADWKPFLREGIKFKLCEFFYRNTVAVGRREFTTSTAQLSRASGAHRRHIFLVLRQLEDLRFIQKESVETNRKDEGLVIRFFPDRNAR